MRQTEIPRSGPIARSLSRTAAFLAFLLLSTSTASAWESDFYDMGSYVGISGLGAIMDLGSTLGDPGSAPIRGISSVKDSGGFRISAGTHVTPWAALQIDFQYVAPVKFESTSNGTQKIPIYTGSLTLKGYPLAKLLGVHSRRTTPTLRKGLPFRQRTCPHPDQDPHRFHGRCRRWPPSIG